MTEVICEAGITHEGNLKTALELVDVAKTVGGKIVKFQTFDPKKLLHEEDPSLEYLALPLNDFKTIAKHCENVGIEFMSTPGDPDSLKFLLEECGMARIKIGSDDLTYRPLLDVAYASGHPVILSTGMGTMDEIQAALPTAPIRALTLLHCTSEYPCPTERINLRAMETLKKFGWPVGYSDHTDNIGACMVAASMGAAIIEKHFAPAGYIGPDAAVSANPNMLRALLVGVAGIETILGSSVKQPTEIELEVRQFLRKGPDGKRRYEKPN